MRIEGIDIYRVAMPLVYPFRTAFGNDAAVESVLVRMCGGGKVGWGESAPWRLPAYSSEFAAGAFLTIREVLAPLVINQEVHSGAVLQGLMCGVKGNYFAKAALDLAWWDLHAKARRKPLYKVLGGTRATVEVGADFGVMESIDVLLRTIGEAVKAGFKRVKLKYRPGWEVDMIAAARSAFPKQVFHVDCNSAYTLANLDMLKKLDRYDLAMIEQPLMHDDLIDHARLQEQLKTPICLDESITSPAKARKAIAIKACRWVNIKPGRVGGLTPALAIHDICRDAGIGCWVGGMLESAVGANHCLALATLPNMLYPSDIFPTQRFYHQDLSKPETKLSGRSEMKLSSTPGLGAEPDPERLAALTVEHATVGA